MLNQFYEYKGGSPFLQINEVRKRYSVSDILDKVKLQLDARYCTWSVNPK